MTTILVAPDSFKGTFSSVQVAKYISAGIREEGLTAIECPLADGGEGTLDVILLALKGEQQFLSVHGPLGQKVVARWGWVAKQRLAIIEVAQACGLDLSGCNPTDSIRSSTVGVGELMIAAATFGAEKIIVATGGSATTDGGQGAIDALQGGLAQTGAAGGLSGALWAALGAELFSGADYVLNLVGFDELANTADAVLLGEGKLDTQSFLGKIVGVAASRIRGRPVLAVVGSTSLDVADSTPFGVSHVWVASNPSELHDTGKVLSRWLTLHT